MPEQDRRTVVITGGSRGIGRAICVAFAGPLTDVFFNYSSDEEGAKETERLVTEKGGQARGFKVNVASETEVEGFFAQVLAQSGRVDVLVNNAGITRDGLLVRMKEKDWDDVININLKGVFNGMKHVGKTMMKQRFGRIVNLTSVVGAMGNPGQANYVASKAGIIGLTKSAAKELASRGITVNAVAPGYVETDMTSEMTDKARQTLLEQIPLGRVAVPDDITPIIVFLASEKAAYITGQVIHVNGGMYM
ncbi:MAG: 3-oxoacyl-[acyl-carrier-protein] reductase [Desulfobacteraceae bacterium]|nr:3-oxoacyl-[acyl-carrier-protein] reductase [Desulfobacteraceae bacterium]MBU4055603.1 3-oxoacyl-[acyl-carrier-protein] reductase [Pseudomonadota bacterium]